MLSKHCLRPSGCLERPHNSFRLVVRRKDDHHLRMTMAAIDDATNKLMETPKQDVQTVTAEGDPVQRLIEGVKIVSAVTHPDERGTLCEISSLALKAHPAPIVYVYQFTIRPGKVKGWHIHHLHDDRIFISQGTVKVVLYDNRPDSPTYRVINEIYRTEHHRTLMVIPAYVFHAHHNVGQTEGPVHQYAYANLPSRKPGCLSSPARQQHDSLPF